MLKMDLVNLNVLALIPPHFLPAVLRNCGVWAEEERSYRVTIISWHSAELDIVTNA
jgi:hypothetical protein